ncbi:MAG: prolipoprotein diacylglyceryl transferase [Candidatus Woesearchaeota archaeon]
MFYHTIDPVLVSLGPISIRYYGLVYILGFVLGYFLLQKLGEKSKLLTKDQASDIILYIAIGAIIGARLIYAIIYNFGYYSVNLIEIFYVWQGGLSFHGGFIGATIALYLYTKKKNLDILKIGDILVIPLAIGLALGRIANFINAELVGRVTSVSWCVYFPGEEECRHPSQIYASIKNMIIFTVLLTTYSLKKLPRGMLVSIFLIMYGSFRFIIEFFRAPDPQLGFIILGLSMGQILSIIVIGVGIWLYFFTVRRK